MAEPLLSDAIRDILNAADDSLSTRQVFDLLCAAGRRGVSSKAVDQVMRRCTATGEFVRGEIGGRVVYTTNPEFSSPLEVRKSRSNTIEAVLELLGKAARPMSTAAVHQALMAQGLALEVKQNSLAWSLSAQAKAGRLQRTKKARDAYWSLPAATSPAATDAGTDAPPKVSPSASSSPSPEVAQASVAAPSSREPERQPAPAWAVERVPIPAAVAEVTAMVRELVPEAHAPAAPTADRFALADRLEAIVQDVQDAMTDACTAELPHALIRHLIAAQDGALRAYLVLRR